VNRRRGSLAARIAALGIAIAVVTGLLAGLLAVGLIRNAEGAAARHTLARLADAAANSADTPRATQRTKRTLAAVNVRFGRLPATGPVNADAALVRAALTPDQVAAVRAGRSISASTRILGTGAYVEARPTTGGGGVVLVQRHGDATAAGGRAIRRTLIAILVGVAVAAVIGTLVARRMARPLRRTAEAAHALAAGRRDVTVNPSGPAEVADVADAVNTLASALTRSEARQREFLMSVSHDLRTPLTAITGYAESLANGLVPADQTAQAGAVMLAEGQRLARLVTDLLDLARLDAQDFRVEPADVDLVELAVAAGHVWQQRCAQVGIAFALQVPAEPVRCRTDAARVRQIVDGLLENALRVTPAGAPIVLAAYVAAPGTVAIEVRDGGPGLRDDDLAVAFERAELHRRYQGVRQVGTGLGLAIVHGLAARLGGSAEAGHAAEGGARFTVRLPQA
jgi:two-component system sensor histidine kinase BaeS